MGTKPPTHISSNVETGVRGCGGKGSNTVLVSSQSDLVS